LRPLAQIGTGAKLIDIFAPLYAAETELNFFLWNPLLPPETCYQSGFEFLEAIKALTSAISDPDKEIDAESYNLKTLLDKFETVLAAEYARKDSFVVSKRNLLDH
jgi:hypothetical protein